MSNAPRPTDYNPSAFAFFLQMNNLRFRQKPEDDKPLSREEATRAKHAMVFIDDEQYEFD